MHQVKTTIRKILPSELPSVRLVAADGTRAATEQELLDMGIQSLGGDFYSCIHQEERDPDTLEWKPIDGRSLPGVVITEGVLADRHAKLPSDVRSKVMRAQIIRSKAGSAKDAVAANLADVGAVLTANVGDVDGAPLIDTSSPEAALVEAQRLAALPDSDLERELVSMDDVAEGDVVEAESLIPHSWAGEPKR